MRLGLFAGLLLAAAWLGAAAAHAAGTPPPVEAYAREEVESVSLSPSGKRVAFISSSKLGRTVYVAEDSKPIDRQVIVDTVTASGKALEAKIRFLRWADDDHLIVYVTGAEDFGNRGFWKGDFGHVLVLNPTTHKKFWVFEGDGTGLSLIPEVLGMAGLATKDGHAVGLFYGREKENTRGMDTLADRIGLYEVDLDTGHAKTADSGVEGRGEWVVGRDGALLAFTTYESREKEWSLFAEAHRALLAKAKDPYYDASLDGQGRTPGTVIYDTPDEGGAPHYFEIGLAAGSKPVPLFEGQAVSGLYFDRATGLLVGAWTEGDVPELTFLDPQRQAVWASMKKAFPNLNASLVSTSADFKVLVVLTEGDGDAGTLWTIDRTTHKADPFAQLHPDVKDADVGPRRMFDYKAADGLAMQGVLTLPPGREAKNLPVVVMPHGGPEARDYLSFDSWAEALAARGYAVFQPNFRGSDGYGAKFVHAGDGEMGRKMQTDISDGLAALAAKGIVDPKRACIMGGSYGGYAALAGVTLQHGLYRCAVADAPVADWSAMVHDVKIKQGEFSAALRVWLSRTGAKGVEDGVLHQISPADHADKADAPILLIHGKEDSTVPFEQSEIMQKALQRAGKPVEFVQLEHEDHYLSRGATSVEMLKAAIDFIEKYNPAD